MWASFAVKCVSICCKINKISFTCWRKAIIKSTAKGGSKKQRGLTRTTEWFLTELRTASKGTSRACLTMPNPCVVSWSKKGLFTFSDLPIQYVCHAKKIGWWEWKHSLQSRVRESIRGQALFKVTALDLKHTLIEKLRYAVRVFSRFSPFFAKMWCDTTLPSISSFSKKSLAQKKMFKLSLCNFKELHLW